MALYDLKRLDDAQAIFRSVPAGSPDSADALFYLGLIELERGRLETAADFWDKATAIRPIFPEANFMLGEALRTRNQLAASREFYEKALGQDSSKLIYYVRLGGVYLVLDERDKAFDTFQRAVQIFPNEAELQYFVGVAARAQGSFDMAEAAFRKALASEPNNADTLAQLGFLTGERAEFAEAEKLFRRAIVLEPRHFYANYNLGRILVKNRRYAEAVPVLENAISVDANMPEAHYQLFLAYGRLGKKAEADEQLAAFKHLDEEIKGHRMKDPSKEYKGLDAAPAVIQP